MYFPMVTCVLISSKTLLGHCSVVPSQSAKVT